MVPSILFLVNDGNFFLSHRLPLALEAKRRGFKVQVSVPPSSADARIEAEGFPVIPVAISRGATHPFRDLVEMLKFASVLRRENPSILHCVTLKASVLGGVAALVARQDGVVFAVTGLGQLFTSKRIHHRILRILVSAAIRFLLNRGVTIVQNPDDRAVLSRIGVSNDRLFLIRGSGVHPDEFIPTEEPDGIPLVILASRLLWAKGVGEFVAAAKAVRASGQPARFALVGDSDEKSSASVPRKQLEAWRDAGVIEWWGRQDDMPGVMRSASIVCLPSKYGEGVPKVLIEAAAAGRPIVTTDTPGCREIVADGLNGYLVSPGDSAGLSLAIQRLLESKELRASMGGASREVFESGFALSTVLGKTFDVYRAALDEVGARNQHNDRPSL